jgi:L-amino acid N-acyltransferase YncA
MTAAFVIRRPTPRDVDSMASVHVDGWRDAYADLVPPSAFGAEALERRRRMWTAILGAADLPQRLAVAEIAGVVAGIAMAGSTEEPAPARDLSLHLIYLRTANHGGGAGQALLDAVIGTEPAQLWVATENPRAIAFYARNGFRPDGLRRVESSLNDLSESRMVR